MEIVSSAKSGYTSLMSTLSKIGALNIEQVEKIADKQLESTQYYTGIGVGQLKGAVDIEGVKGVKEFSSESVTASSKIAKKVLEDGREMISLGVAYKDGLVGIVKSAGNG